jgi:ubiquitin carboxyl-terminal hydrolase L5
MFNLLCIRSAAIPRLTRLLNNTTLETQDQLSLSDQLEHEQTKLQKGRVENTLRQHNLLPVVFQLFKAMGESGQMGKQSPTEEGCTCVC